MTAARVATGVVLTLTTLALLGALVSLLVNGVGLATGVVLVVAVLAVAGACVLGARSRRWRSNPYW